MVILDNNGASGCDSLTIEGWFSGNQISYITFENSVDGDTVYTVSGGGSITIEDWNAYSINQFVFSDGIYISELSLHVQ